MRKFLPFVALLAACSGGASSETRSGDSLAPIGVDSQPQQSSAPPPPPPSYDPPGVTTSRNFRVDNVDRLDTIASPFTVKGVAHGSWYFEAQFLLRLVDSNGKQLAIIPAHAQGDWMRDTLVPFSGQLQWKGYQGRGELVFQNDNPSGDPKHDKQWRLPVVVR